MPSQHLQFDYVIQHVINQSPHILYDSPINYSNRAARNLLAHLFKTTENIWANGIVLEMTQLMLRTEFYLYKSNWGWCKYRQLYDIFSAFQSSLHYLKDVPETSNQSLYINHHRTNHFEPCHTGLVGR